MHCRLTGSTLASLFVAIALAISTGCSSSNDIFFGRVEATVGSHRVVVMDCYRISVPPPTVGGQPLEYVFAPCRDSEVRIRAVAATETASDAREEVFVNSKSYGRVAATAAILVDHGAVSINGQHVAMP